MAEGDLPIINKSAQETNEWLREISEQMEHPDRQVAYHALRGVLFALRDRLSVEEAVQLSAQLPTFVRGVYFEGYRPANKPLTYRDRDEFLERVGAELEASGPANPEDAARGVFAVLQERVSAGEVEDVRQMLPKHIRTLWPEESLAASNSVLEPQSTVP